MHAAKGWSIQVRLMDTFLSEPHAWGYRISLGSNEPMAFNLLQFVSKWVADHLSPHYSSILALFLGFLLWSPESWLKYFHLFEFSQNYRWAISLTLILSVSVLVVTLVEKASKNVHSWFRRILHQRLIQKYILTMPTDQLEILLKYAKTDKSSLNFELSNGAVCDLVNRGILYQPSKIGHYIEGFPFSIHPNAQAFLTRGKYQKILLARSKAKR